MNEMSKSKPLLTELNPGGTCLVQSVTSVMENGMIGTELGGRNMGTAAFLVGTDLHGQGNISDAFLQLLSC